MLSAWDMGHDNGMWCIVTHQLWVRISHIIITPPYPLHFIRVHPMIPVVCPVCPIPTYNPASHLIGLHAYCLGSHLSGLHALWCIIRVRCPNWEVGTNQGFLARTPCGSTHEWHMVQSSWQTTIQMRKLWRLWHIIRARCPNQKWGATWCCQMQLQFRQ